MHIKPLAAALIGSIVSIAALIFYFLNRKLKRSSEESKKTKIAEQTKPTLGEIDNQKFLLQLDELFNQTTLKTVRLVTKNETCSPKDSRFAGRPWLPEGFEYPCGEDAQEMKLLAQLNFRQMPELDGFPHKGILQFYITNDESLGMDFDEKTGQANFRVIYHENEDIPGCLACSCSVDEGFPIGRELKIDFVESEEPISYTDYRFADAFEEHTGMSFLSLPEPASNLVMRRFDGAGHKVGGYPYFTQYDPRDINSDCDVLLLQIDSNEKEGIMWGDCGVANFFISAEDLAACRFDNLLYNWDCC